MDPAPQGLERNQGELTEEEKNAYRQYMRGVVQAAHQHFHAHIQGLRQRASQSQQEPQA